MNEVQWCSFVAVWMKNVYITCFADDLMSTWCCHMKDPVLHSKHSLSIYTYLVSYSALAQKTLSKAISSAPSTRMVISNVIITAITWVHLWNGGEKKIFLSGWKNNLWSFFCVLLRALENNNTPQQRHMNAVINLMGFAYFVSAEGKQEQGNTWYYEKWKQWEIHSEKHGFLSVRICLPILFTEVR